jgi:hypothetical protein
LEARGDDDVFAENPLRGGWAEVGWLLGHLGLGQEEREGEGNGLSPGKGERVLPLFFFFWFYFSFQNSNFKTIFGWNLGTQISDNFLNTHGLLKNNKTMLLILKNLRNLSEKEIERDLHN